MAEERAEPLGVPDRGPRSRGVEAVVSSGRPNALDGWAARRFVEVTGGEAVGIALWDGKEVVPRGEAPGCVRVHDRGALWGLLRSPAVSFGDLYSVGRVSIEGDLVAVLEHVFEALMKGSRSSPARRFFQRLASLSAPSIPSARHNIHHHYDLGNDFYAMWLDREAMQYTCAYYPSRGLSLEEAQLAKMDHICRKLWLRPGESVVEAGSGWGGFALHMAKHYGVTVRAFNISSEQNDFARAWAAREGLADRVEFVDDDYRNIDGRCDVFVSVGMLEHVGPGNYRVLGQVIDRCLAGDGRGLIHSIGRDRPVALHPWITKRIFPGARPPTLAQMSPIFEPAGLSILDVENLRLHYALTLREWLARYESHLEETRAMFDDRFVRAWRLYLASSVAAFSAGSLQLFQVLFARSGDNALPWSRAHVYRHEAPSEEG